MEDSGALPVEMDVKDMNMGDVIDVCFKEGVVKKHGTDTVVSRFSLKSDVLHDEVQAGGRIPLIIGRGLTGKAREALKLEPSKVFRSMKQPDVKVKGYTLAQKLVGKACGVPGVVPGAYCEPSMGAVGSQDTTGPMTRDELKDLACLGFSADLTMQSFCHTAAYPKPVDVTTHQTLPKFIADRGGVALRPGDGIIHSWLNRMLLPDQAAKGSEKVRETKDNNNIFMRSHCHAALSPRLEPAGTRILDFPWASPSRRARASSPSRLPQASCLWTCQRAPLGLATSHRSNFADSSSDLITCPSTHLETP